MTDILESGPKSEALYKAHVELHDARVALDEAQQRVNKAMAAYNKARCDAFNYFSDDGLFTS